MFVAELIKDVLDHADAKGISRARLAEKAGIRPETLSRLQCRRNADFMTVSNLAAAAGFRVQLVPLDGSKGDRVFSPVDRAREKARSRRRDDKLVRSGRMSRNAIHRRNSFLSLAGARDGIE
jgi:transcriptional regulator with XRE-family HTH domain